MLGEISNLSVVIYNCGCWFSQDSKGGRGVREEQQKQDEDRKEGRREVNRIGWDVERNPHRNRDR